MVSAGNDAFLKELSRKLLPAAVVKTSRLIVIAALPLIALPAFPAEKTLSSAASPIVNAAEWAKRGRAFSVAEDAQR